MRCIAIRLCQTPFSELRMALLVGLGQLLNSGHTSDVTCIPSRLRLRLRLRYQHNIVSLKA